MALIAAALAYGCASSAAPSASPPTSAADRADPAQPLASFAGRQIVVLPAQLVSVGAVPGRWDVRAEYAPLLPLLDEEIAAAFRARGIRGNWTFARELSVAAARNAGLAGNPAGLPVAGIRRVRAGDTPLPEPLASDIRSLVSLTSARYVIMPIETKVELTGSQRRAALNLLLIDSRTARVAWVGEVTGQYVRDVDAVRETFTPHAFRLLSRELAGLFADLVVSP